MKKHKKRISAQIDGKHISEGKKIVQKFFSKNAKKCVETIAIRVQT